MMATKIDQHFSIELPKLNDFKCFFFLFRLSGINQAAEYINIHGIQMHININEPIIV